MPSKAAAELDLDGAARYIELIMDYQDMIEVDIVFLHDLRYGASGSVHEALGFRQDQIVPMPLHVSAQSTAFILPVSRTKIIGDGIERIEACIMARMLILLTRISQTYDRERPHHHAFQ